MITKKIDELGKLKTQLTALEKRKVILEKEIKAEIKVGESHFGKNFKAVMTERNNSSLNIKKIKKMLGDKNFMKVIKVVKGKAEQLLSMEQLDKCSDIGEPSKVMTISKLSNNDKKVVVKEETKKKTKLVL